METEEKLPVWRKICFAAGGFPVVVTNNVLLFFFPMFLLEVAQIPPQYASVILLTGEVWDAVSDPLCGYLINKTDTRFGKYRPWIFCTAPFLCAVYFCLWYVPEVTTEGKFAWYFLFYLLSQTCLTCIAVPGNALTMVITNDQKERDSATAYKKVAIASAALISSAVQGQLVNKYRRVGQCGSTVIQPNQGDGERWSYTLGSLVGIGLVLVGSLVVVFGTKERKQVNVAEGHSNIWRNLRLVVTFKPFIMLSLIAMTTSMTVSMNRGNLGLFFTHALHLGNHFANFILTFMVAFIVSTPVWQLCLVKFGKKTTFAAGIIIVMPMLASLLIGKGNAYVFYVIMTVGGICVSCTVLLPWSMMPDVLDEFYVKTGKRIDAIFYSFFAFFIKLGLGVGLAVSQGALALGGYKVGACSQPDTVGLTLRILVGVGPLLFNIVALVLLYLYPINEQKRAQNRMEMTVRSNAINSSVTATSPLFEEETKRSSQTNNPTEEPQDV